MAGGIRAAENVEYTKLVQYSSEAISLVATCAAINRTGTGRMRKLSLRLMSSAVAKCRSEHRISGLGTPRYPASAIVVSLPFAILL